MKKDQPYNPLDKKNLGESVALKMLSLEPEVLPPRESFKGAGIYAIYYVGKHPLYGPIASQNLADNFSAPIYVGKAIPSGARKGGVGTDEEVGPVLFKRLQEHAESIQQAKNLNLADFSCRYLVVEDVWIPLAESLLIQMFRPVWNQVVDGFGNHDPGSGRYAQKKSPWDVLHPGRAWANKLTGVAPVKKDLNAKVIEFLARPAPEEATIKKPRRKLKVD